MAMRAAIHSLQKHDWLHMQEFLLRLHSAASLAELPATILGALREVIPYDSGSFQDDRGGLREIPWLFEEQSWQPRGQPGRRARGSRDVTLGARVHFHARCLLRRQCGTASAQRLLSAHRRRLGAASIRDPFDARPCAGRFSSTKSRARTGSSASSRFMFRPRLPIPRWSRSAAKRRISRSAIALCSSCCGRTSRPRGDSPGSGNAIAPNCANCSTRRRARSGAAEVASATLRPFRSHSARSGSAGLGRARQDQRRDRDHPRARARDGEVLRRTHPNETGLRDAHRRRAHRARGGRG